VLENRYGRFENAGRTYVITDHRTPAPWSNVISNGHYGLVVSQTGSGFSWLDDSQQNVLTRWEMDLTRDSRGRALYLADLDDGAVWSLAPAPCFVEAGDFECAHEPGVTTFRQIVDGVRTTWTLSVAPHLPVEVWRVTIANESGRERRLRVASFLEWCLGVAPDSKREFHRLFIQTHRDEARGAVIARKHLWDVPPADPDDRWNRSWPHVAGHALRSAELEPSLAIASVPAFIGRYADPRRPIAMRDGATLVAGFGRGHDACAALGADMTLTPGQTVRADFVLVVGADEADVQRQIDAADHEFVDQAIHQTRSDWAARLGFTEVATERPDLDALCNTWLPYQAISGRLWARTGYYQQSGAFGFRDQLQDSQVWLPIDASQCRAQILRHAAQQYADGSVNHWWHPLTGQCSHTSCSDDYLWLVYVTCAYIRETGKLSILEEQVPFADDPRSETLLGHCRRAIERGWMRRSDRGLPLLGACDWNDGLSAAGLEGRGESVWLSFFMAEVFEQMSVVFDRLERAAEASELRKRRAALLKAANAHAWDGAWFRRATTDAGDWLGASTCDAGRIYLNPQTWAILTGGAEPERLIAAWASVREHLLREMGPLLLAPAYAMPDPKIGYITRYAPGARENGGVYMHAATWALGAACAMRDLDAVERIWDAISPAWRARDADAYVAEPYVTPGNVDGPDAEMPGRAGWTWYTGSAAWMQRIVHEQVIGVRPDWEGLRIDPCPPRSLGAVRMVRQWRGHRIEIEFDASDFAPDRETSVTLNGRPLHPAVIHPSMLDGPVARVVVTWADRLVSTPARDPALAKEVSS
jgi:cellobiose phosphorylase